MECFISSHRLVAPPVFFLFFTHFFLFLRLSNEVVICQQGTNCHCWTWNFLTWHPWRALKSLFGNLKLGLCYPYPPSNGSRKYPPEKLKISYKSPSIWISNALIAMILCMHIDNGVLHQFMQTGGATCIFFQFEYLKFCPTLAMARFFPVSTVDLIFIACTHKGLIFYNVKFETNWSKTVDFIQVFNLEDQMRLYLRLRNNIYI